jgi:thiamine pyrophosphate-dependent acetolactate synthase large subunit-like protein
MTIVGSDDVSTHVRSTRPGDFAHLFPFFCPFVACVLGGTVGELARGLHTSGFILRGARSEMGAGFYALGACLGDPLSRPALVLTVGGGAAAALAQPLWCARVQQVPVLAITGEVSSTNAGLGAVQDGTGLNGPSIVAMTRALTCRSVAVWSAEEAWREFLRCFELCIAHRLPAHLSVPIDVQRQLLGGLS